MANLRPRMKHLTVRCTDKSKRLLQQCADVQGISRSMALRQAIQTYAAHLREVGILQHGLHAVYKSDKPQKDSDINSVEDQNEARRQLRERLLKK